MNEISTAAPRAQAFGVLVLRVIGDSMLSPQGRHSYADGDFIRVDTARQPKVGDRCIARLGGSPSLTFRQLVEKDGARCLEALNPTASPRFIALNEHAIVVGTVIAKWHAEQQEN